VTLTAPRLADGTWHRLHPATPLLRGGIALVAILGFIAVSFRDLLIQVAFGGPGEEDDPILWIAANGLAGVALLSIILGVALFVAGFYLSWRMHSFRITDEVVEVRSGILFRTNRRARLDRIQGINVVRPFVARLFGAAKLEVDVAGQGANVQLTYLGSSAADELRREILILASGTKPMLASTAGASGGLLERRVEELLAPELDPALAAPESVVQLNIGRLVGSIVLSGFTVVILVTAVVATLFVSLSGDLFYLAGFVPALIGFGGYYIKQFTRSLRYSIASTPDGVRVGFGLLTTSNETLPPGRIHAIQVRQPLLWRVPGWWEIRINRATPSSSNGTTGQAQTTILPVGNLADVRKVLELVLPTLVDSASIGLVERGLTSRGGDDGFANSPSRARALLWFSRRRNGFALTADSVLLRRGAIWRQLVIVPLARVQSVALHQAPLSRLLRLATIRVHTVRGPVEARLGAVDAAAATGFFTEIAAAAISSAHADTSHRWRTSP
jgi:putative membrane protein